MRYTNHKLFLVCFAILIIGGCAANMTTRKTSSNQFSTNPRIAILPFENLSGKEKAGQKITEYFQTFMAGQMKITSIEYGQTFEAIKKLRIRSSALLTDEQIDGLAKELQVTYILTGSVLEYDEFDNSYLGKVPQVSFNTRLIDCATKTTAWVGASNGSGDKGELLFGIGAVRSADQLAHSMVQKAVSGIAGLFK